jgi:hypothetical protein
LSDQTTPAPLTAERLGVIRQRADAASDGPWRLVDLRHQRGGRIRIFPAAGLGYIVANVLTKGERPAADAEFIVHARTDVPSLLAEVERLRAHVTELERAHHPRCDADIDTTTGTYPCWLPAGHQGDHDEDTHGTLWDHELDRLCASRDAEGPATDVIELTLRAHDVEMVDDGGAELLLTTDTGQPARLRLDPDQRRALRDDLADEGDGETFTEWGVHPGDDEDDEDDVDVRDDRCEAEGALARWRDMQPGAYLVHRTVHRGPWQSVGDGG